MPRLFHTHLVLRLLAAVHEVLLELQALLVQLLLEAERKPRPATRRLSFEPTAQAGLRMSLCHYPTHLRSISSICCFWLASACS